MSPTAAAAHARRAIRSRCKALRLGATVEPPSIFAGRLGNYAVATAQAFPVPPSQAYAEFVEAQFSDRFLALCKVNPVKVVRG